MTPSIHGFVEGYTAPVNDFIFKCIPFFVTALIIVLLFFFIHKLSDRHILKRAHKIKVRECVVLWGDADVIQKNILYCKKKQNEKTNNRRH